MDIDNIFNHLSLPHMSLDGELDASTSEEFVNQFRTIFSQQKARESRSVVYVWSTQKSILRLKEIFKY